MERMHIQEDDAVQLPHDWYDRTDDMIYSARRAIATIAGQPIGVVWFAAYGGANIAAVFVAAPYRRKQVATRLCEFASKSMRCSFSRLEPVVAASAAGRGLTKKLGATLAPQPEENHVQVH